MAVTGFYVRRSGFTHVGELMLSVVEDMKNNGFTVRYPNNWVPPVDPEGKALFKVALEAGPDVDPLNETAVLEKQPWRVNIQVFDKHTAGIVVGSPQAVKADGSLAFVIQGTTTKTLKGPLGVIGGTYTKTPSTPELIAPDSDKPLEGFINRRSRVILNANDLSESFPMTYSLTISKRGMVLCVWEDYNSDSTATAISWFAVQRPVDRVTGATVVDGKAPVFCVYSTNGTINRYVVRESDVLRPSDAVDAAKDTDYNNAIMNGIEQIAISEGNSYIVNFPSRLNTTRYAYTYEMDLIGYTSADVVSENTVIPLVVYGEKDEADDPLARKYVALLANGPNNTGMRLVTLQEGGGISLV